MGRVRTIARRSFLIGSVAIVGGVAFGTYLYKRPIENPLLDDHDEGEAAITPYVLITEAGVTIITPRADGGQGSFSVLAAMVAEELDIPLEDVTVDPGPASPAYYNGKVAAEGFPFAANDSGVVARSARLMGDVAAKLLGLHLTGGSTTVPDGYDKMRVAGAVARDVLLQAAAQETGIDRNRLATDAGAVVLPDGTRMPYTALAGTAATIEPPSEVPLKHESEWKLLGTEMLRVDIVGKSTGTLEYASDVSLPDLVFATPRTNPRIGGGVVGFDDSSARAVAGVIDVVAIEGGAAVVADNTWAAFKGAEALEMDWGDARPYPDSSAEMWDILSESFVPERQDSQLRDDGDVTVEIDGARVLEAEYRIPYLAHAPLEPLSATARLKDGHLEIWTSTQIPIFAVNRAADIAGIEPEEVTLHNGYAGGSFGRRLEDDYVAEAVQIAVAMEGRPVRVTRTREEDMSHDFPRPMGMACGRGAVKDGQVVSLDLNLATPSVASSQLARLGQPVIGPDIAIVAGAWDQSYAIPNYRVTGYRAPPMVPVSSWRSVGASGNGFLHESFLDELIWEAGADPVQERLRLLDDPFARLTLEAAAEMADWQGPRPEPGVGRGVALCLAFGVQVAEIVEVRQSDAGLVISDVWVAAEVGRVLDPVNFENQVAGGVIWGLGHAMNCELTYRDGQPEQTNFHAFEGLRMHNAPRVHVRGLENSETIRGMGEPSVPPAAPALANAVFAATGERMRELPLSRSVQFA